MRQRGGLPVTTEEQFAEAWAGYLRTRGVGGMLDVGPEDHVPEHDAAWWAWQMATEVERRRCIHIARQVGKCEYAQVHADFRKAASNIRLSIEQLGGGDPILIGIDGALTKTLRRVGRLAEAARRYMASGRYRSADSQIMEIENEVAVLLSEVQLPCKDEHR